MNIQDEIKNNFVISEENWQSFATKSSEAIRLNEEKDDYRPSFFKDIDRIIYSLSYTRYIDKTQVYSFLENDHISKRIVHVQLVSKIARTIGRALRLNTDLIEAIALGHDIGHTPLGHAGEKILNEISKEEIDEYFCHNVQSMRNYMYLEKNGKGLNLTIQTLDGILCHNGEVLLQEYKPVKKTAKDVINQFENSYKDKSENNKMPMTIEGCVVRISDIIAYVGRDIEDSINLNIIKREQIPKKIKKILGDNNRDIVNNIVTDIIINSFNKPYIRLSDEIYNAIKELMKFNYQNIYYKTMTKQQEAYYKEGMKNIFKAYKRILQNEEKNNDIYKVFLNNQNEEYLKNNSSERKIIDFIAGMTDDYFMNQVKKYTKK